MFGKIKDKLKNIFNKNEEIIEENSAQQDSIENKKESLDDTNKNKNNKKSNQSNNKIEQIGIKEEKTKLKDEIVIEEENLKKEKKEKKGFFSAITKKTITENDFNKIWLELEIFLLEINVAFEIVEKISEELKKALIGNSFSRFSLSEKIRNVLEEEIAKVLEKREGNFLEEIKRIKKDNEIVKILILGVNGTGKTTSIAKIVKYLNDNDFSVVVSASDTFRAAASEQLEEHSKKLNFKLISHKGKSDPAAVAFDSIEHAKSKKIDVVLIDTAGRMPNNSNLMMELQKIKRVANTDISLFIGDSISGNDLIDQIDLFDKIIGIDGVLLSKVDTDERPGSIISCAYSIEKPIYFLGNRSRL
jgi:fused signal recognition particle receptor